MVSVVSVSVSVCLSTENPHATTKHDDNHRPHGNTPVTAQPCSLGVCSLTEAGS